MDNFSVTWDTDYQHILHIVMDPAWTWQNFSDAIQVAYAETNRVDHPVTHVITGMTQQVPAGNALTRLKFTLVNRPQNLEKQVIVGYNAFLDKMFEIFVRVYRHATPVEFAPTLDEAREASAATQV